MLTHSGFSAWITTDGKELVEYESVIDKTLRRTSCWIGSQEGKRFTVHWRDNGGKVDTATYIKLDGLTVPGHFLFGAGEAERDAVRVGPSTERAFMFSKLDEVSPTAMAESSKRPRPGEIGTIMVKIRRVKRTRQQPANKPIVALAPTVTAKPPGDMCIDYGAERGGFRQQPVTWHVEPYDRNHPGSYVTFIFRYRSRQFLVSQGIMTRTSPVYREISQPKLFIAPSPSASDTSVSTPAHTGTPGGSPKHVQGAYNPRNQPQPEAGPSRLVSANHEAYENAPWHKNNPIPPATTSMLGYPIAGPSSAPGSRVVSGSSTISAQSSFGGDDEMDIFDEETMFKDMDMSGSW